MYRIYVRSCGVATNYSLSIRSSNLSSERVAFFNAHRKRIGGNVDTNVSKTFQFDSHSILRINNVLRVNAEKMTLPKEGNGLIVLYKTMNILLEKRWLIFFSHLYKGGSVSVLHKTSELTNNSRFFVK